MRKYARKRLWAFDNAFVLLKHVMYRFIKGYMSDQTPPNLNSKKQFFLRQTLPRQTLKLIAKLKQQQKIDKLKHLIF